MCPRCSCQVIYKIDIPANRYDMLCLEGIARALNIFRGRQAPPQYRLADMSGEAALSEAALSAGASRSASARQLSQRVVLSCTPAQAP